MNITLYYFDEKRNTHVPINYFSDVSKFFLVYYYLSILKFLQTIIDNGKFITYMNRVIQNTHIAHDDDFN